MSNSPSFDDGTNLLLNQIARNLRVAPAGVRLIFEVCQAEFSDSTKTYNPKQLIQAIEQRIQTDPATLPQLQLAEWHIVSIEQIGKIVVSLEAFTLIEPQPGLHLRDFQEAHKVQLEEYSEAVTGHSNANSPTHSNLFRWSIGGIFVITTIVAAAMPGATRFGVAGAFFSLLAVWLTIIGGVCIYVGICSQRGKLLTIALGVYLMLLGLAGYLLMLAINLA